VASTAAPSLFIDKYKPYYLSDFTHDSIPKKIIHTLLDIDDLNILFIGNTSSGKTTLLYALLREYYGLSKTDPISETNIMFINNLKEQGINYFRNEMKTFCQSHCSIYGKKKIIVIDDMDMVNEQSQQVFRNYLDKYKSNIHFLAACTNVQKVIESLQSRLHILHFSAAHAPRSDLCEHTLRRIVREESLALTDDSIAYILDKSGGSVRHVINHLEKIHLYANPGQLIELPVCEKLCSTLSFQPFEEYIAALREGKLSEAIRVLYNIHDYGYSVIDIYDFFFSFVKTTKSLTEDEKYNLLPILCKYITIFHNTHEDCIELALFTNHIKGNLRFPLEPSLFSGEISG
jgi:DNA polymerase III delta prime subunit